MDNSSNKFEVTSGDRKGQEAARRNQKKMDQCFSTLKAGTSRVESATTVSAFRNP
jgi:hypothetical protein